MFSLSMRVWKGDIPGTALRISIYLSFILLDQFYFILLVGLNSTCIMETLLCCFVFFVINDLISMFDFYKKSTVFGCMC